MDNNKTMRRNRRRQRINLITNIAFSLVALTALTGCIALLLQNYVLKNESRETMGRLNELEDYSSEHIYTREELDAYVQGAAVTAKEAEREAFLGELKSKISGGESTVSILREFYPDDIVVYADNNYFFFPISDQLKKHSYLAENFVRKNENEIVYIDENEETVSFKGVDVSRHQGIIDWRRVSGEDISYAFIRAGFRGNTEGKLAKDEYFKDNIEGALENDIDVGVYFYTQALNEEEAVEEAEFVLDLIEPYDISYPIVFDLEETNVNDARTADMTKEEYTRAAIAFCKTIKEAGYTPMIYGNLKTFMLMLDMEQLEEYDKWFAYYDESVYFPYEFAVWQYSAKGAVSGIGGDVDMNVCMKDYAGEKRE
ncbi:MAG: glycoside hydrolase family 25 protein [Clostridium sp.]|nr:glycoside hydrolase family 25 protein [Clostridium sp.]